MRQSHTRYETYHGFLGTAGGIFMHLWDTDAPVSKLAKRYDAEFMPGTGTTPFQPASKPL